MNWRRIFQKLAGSGDSPSRTAAAFALGAFLSFSPLLGLQIATGMALAFLLRLNRLAVFVGLNMNFPWIMIPWYTLTTIAGSRVLHQPIGHDFSARFTSVLELSFYSAAFWRRLYDLLAPFFWSFFVGSMLGAAVVGIASYFLTVPILTRLRDRSEPL